MRSAVVVFPGSNRDFDLIKAIADITGRAPAVIWHQDSHIPDVDFIALPGGFSYGDYLRCGAIAAQSAAMKEVARHAARGVRVLGVCNGFQILTEARLLPGVLMRNASLKFVCRQVKLQIANGDSDFTRAYRPGEILSCPVAHHDGNYFADDETLRRIEGDGRVAFRYTPDTNPNGSVNHIAGILNAKGNVLGMMPHPENLIEALHGGLDGRGVFESVLGAVAA